jgi:acyl carrier protein
VKGALDMQCDVKGEVQCFIANNFLFRDDRASIGDEESLLDANIIDSTGVLELVAFVEERFGITMADEEIIPENLDSVRAICAYVEKKKSGAAAAERQEDRGS